MSFANRLYIPAGNLPLKEITGMKIVHLCLNAIQLQLHFVHLSYRVYDSIHELLET